MCTINGMTFRAPPCMFPTCFPYIWPKNESEKAPIKV